MAKLEAMLEQRGLATAREVSEAVARCQLHGGDLTTSLLQFMGADESLLSATLSECYGLPTAAVGALPAADDGALRSLPRDVAERYCCFPLQASPGRLVLAVAQPLEPTLKEELGATLGVVIEERVALEVRIRQALSRSYGLPLSARNQRGIARLEGDLDGAAHEPPLGLWSETQLSALPRSPSDLPPSHRDSPRPPSARPRLRAEAARLGSSSAPPAATPKASRRRAPLTLAQAREELGRAGSRNDVLDVFFGFACQFFEYSALFAVHNSLAEGLDAWGKGADRDAVLGVGVPLDLPSSLSEAAESCKVRLTRLGKEGIDRTLAVDLQRQSNGKALLLPVSLRGRCAVLLYADNGEVDVVERDIADVIAIAPDVANGLARIILLRKKEARNKPKEASDGNPPPQARRSQPALAAGVAPRPEARAASAATAAPSDVTRGALPNAPSPPSRGGVQPQPVVSIGPDTNHVTRARPSAPPATNPRNGAAPAPSPSGEDPVFLLARPQPKTQPTEPAAPASPRATEPAAPTSAASPRATEPAAPTSAASPRATEAAAPASPRATATARGTIREAAKVPKPQVAITVPARLEPSRPRLPSVIVEPDSADPDASDRATRATAVTRAPTQARSSPPARRPAVPLPADAPRRADRDPRSAPTTPPAARHAIDDAPASARGAELPASNAGTGGLMPPAVSEVDPDSLEDIGALIGPSSDVWPPPIMDHSPPPPRQALTALVPIIIADPPKNRRMLKGSARPSRAGARPSPSSPPGSAPSGASPTVPSPARMRSLEPHRSAVPAPVDVRTLSSEPRRAPEEADVGSIEAAAPHAEPPLEPAAEVGRSELATAAVAAPASETNGASERTLGPKTLPGAGAPPASPPAPSAAIGTASASSSGSVLEPTPALEAPGHPPLPSVPGPRAAAAPLEPSIRTGNTVPAGSGGGPDGLPRGESPPATAAPTSSEVQAAGVASAHGPTPSNGSAPASGERRTANAAGAISQPAAPRDSGQRLAQRAAGPSVAPPQSGTARAGGLAPQPAANGTSSAASARDAVSPSTAPGSADGTRAPTSGAKTPSAAPSAPWRPAAWLPASRPPASEHAPPSRPAAPTAHSEASAGPASSATHDLARPPEPAAVERPAIFPPPPTDSAIEELVESICQGDLRAAQELARIGAPSLPQVMARFPGPVVSERPSSRASECGPLLRALATIGSPAMPSITQRSEDPDARVRRWATLLLGEMPSAEACRAVVRRLADDVPRVHQAALDAARLLLAGPAAEAFRDTLFEVAKADDSPLTLRLRTLEHVAKLKDSASVPRLIAFLAADLEPVVHKALWALTVVTRRDHGRDASAWTDFWEQNRGRHRVEWLIDALDPGDPRASRAAAEDLREEAGELFGYNDEQSPEERREVQQKFRTWWQTGAVRRRPSFP